MCQLDSQLTQSQQVQGLDQAQGVDMQGTRPLGLSLRFSTVL